MDSKRIFISKTPAEWAVIDNRLKEMKKADLSNYLRSNVMKLTEELGKGSIYTTKESVERQPSIPIEMYHELEMVSKKMNKSIASIVNDYLITPLLHQAVLARQDSA